MPKAITVPSTNTKIAKPRAVRETAAARKLRESAELAVREKEFQLNRVKIWTKLWIQALRLELMTEDMEEMREENSYWFRGFRVHAGEEYFMCERTHAHLITEKGLTLDLAERLEGTFEEGFSLLEDFLAAKERQRVQAETDERDRQAAMSKLSDREKQLLRIR